MITVNSDLTSNIVTDDGLLECNLPSYNPETQVAFSSETEVIKFINTRLLKNPNYFFTKLSDEEKLTQQQKAESESIRSQRDSFLVSSDWTQVADSPVDKEAWATYRQALRDVTDQNGFPHDITWPTQPE